MNIENEDSLGFPTGIMIIVFAYAAGFCIYQWGYMNGADSEKCNRRHSYHLDGTLPAFAENGK